MVLGKSTGYIATMSCSENVNVTMLTCGPWYVIGIYDLMGIQGKRVERQHFELNNKCKRARLADQQQLLVGDS